MAISINVDKQVCYYEYISILQTVVAASQFTHIKAKLLEFFYITARKFGAVTSDGSDVFVVYHKIGVTTP